MPESPPRIAIAGRRIVQRRQLSIRDPAQLVIRLVVENVDPIRVGSSWHSSLLKEWPVSTSKRYAHAIDARMDARVLERIASGGLLQTLTLQELRLHVVPLTVDPKPHRRLRAWVRLGDSPARVDAIAVRWTSDAVGIKFRVGDTEHRCWVWGSAVEELAE